MAFDEWIFEEAVLNPKNIYLRLYTWSGRGGITFGVNQKSESALDHKKLNGITAIRRITGGRAIYHDPSELTYSIALGIDNLPNGLKSGSIKDSSLQISEILMNFLAELGFNSKMMKQSSKENSNPSFFHKAPCFASHGRYEVMGEMGKLIASAQRRYQNTLFQHGSIKINGLKSHPALFESGDNPFDSKELTKVSSEDFLRMSNIFQKSFENSFNIKFSNFSNLDVGEKKVKIIENSIAKNPLLKRDIIKQKLP